MLLLSIPLEKANASLLLPIVFFHLITSSIAWRLHGPSDLAPAPAANVVDQLLTSEHTPLPVLPRWLELNDWTLSWDTWAFPFPITNAASTLERFYDAITASVIAEWQFMEPLQSFSVRGGLFEMRFDCDESPIPWRVVSFVAGLLADEAEIGWAGLYQIRLYNAADRIALRVALRLIAPGDGG